MTVALELAPDHESTIQQAAQLGAVRLDRRPPHDAGQVKLRWTPQGVAEHYGNGDYESKDTDDSELEYIMSLIKQAVLAE